MSLSRYFYITTPIYYVNDRPHIGHAYTTLACDFLARFKRLDGFEVKLLTGTDEHGQKVARSAQAEGVDPKAFVDGASLNFRRLAQLLNCSNDDFIRTTEPRHARACRALWQVLTERGEIYLDRYSGWYAVRDEAFYQEDELRQDSHGQRIAPSGAVCEWVEEPSYFFRLSAWQERLLEFYRRCPDFVRPAARLAEVVAFVSSGLKDLSISRTSFKWGVAVPDGKVDNDPGRGLHVMYVWLDALTNYISALGYPDKDSDQWQGYWPADVHVVGKDILRFHAVYWPAFLLAAGLEPPKRVFAHGWWTIEGQKMSKSLGNVVDPADLVRDYGLDQIRYFLLREVPFGQDGNFSYQAVVGRINSELANDYGNLVQRELSMVARYCQSAVPQPQEMQLSDLSLLDKAYILADKLRSEIEEQAIHKALTLVWQLIAAANRYVNQQAPWELAKNSPARCNTVLYVLAEVIRHIAILTQPVMPGASSAILDQLGVRKSQRSFAALGKSGALEPGTPLPEPVPVFPRHE